MDFVLVNREGRIVFAAPTAQSVLRLAKFFNARPGRQVFGTVQFFTTDERCHCGAAFLGSDHCPECACEQYERYCDHTCEVS